MNAMLFPLFLVFAAHGDAPTIVFDNRPEKGVPPDALAQRPIKPLAQGRAKTLQAMTDGTIKTIRIRYFNKQSWARQKQASEYVAAFLTHKPREVYDFQVWSQSVGVPEIECLIDFTDKFRRKLNGEQKRCREGRLLIWNTESCFRDATGRWWFVNAFDHFHRSELPQHWWARVMG